MSVVYVHIDYTDETAWSFNLLISDLKRKNS